MSALDTIDLLEHGVLRFITAGSVDDGKSTLIGRLLYDTKAILADQLAAIARTSQRRGQALDLSLLTDGLSAEREQGITIDVAYRYFATALRKFIIADTPGHEQYTRNMVTGASTADLAILLVDARHGIVTQTRRHATIAHLLGIPHLVVAVNKMDLVDFDQGVFAAIVADFTAFAEASGIRRRAFRSDVGARRRHGRRPRRSPAPGTPDRRCCRYSKRWKSAPTLAQGPLRFPVQFVAQAGGRAASRLHGPDRIGLDRRRRCRDRAAVGCNDARVRAIRTYEGDRRHAGLHASVTIVLDKELDISRGDMLVASGVAHRRSSRTRRRIALLAGERAARLRAAHYLLRHTTREVRARVERIDYLLERLDAVDESRRRRRWR